MMFQIKLVAYAVSLLVVVNQLSGCSTVEPIIENESHVETDSPKEKPFIEITDTTFAFVGSIRQSSGKLIGSTVLIGSNVALTAAHCLIETEISYVEFGGDMYTIDYTVSYEKETYRDHDIGLIFLDEDVVGVDPVSRASDLFSVVKKWDHVISIGYSGNVKKVSSMNTFRFYGVLYKQENQIQVLPIKGSIWFGDSGGGLFRFGANGFQLIGILASFSQVDDAIVENTSTRVDWYYEWIESEILKSKIPII